jgi:hypothetical protein
MPGKYRGMREFRLRLEPGMLERLENRAIDESLSVRVDVSVSDLLRRGAAMVLDTPSPLPRRDECLIVSTVYGGKCLICKMEFADGDEAPACPKKVTA